MTKPGVIAVQHARLKRAAAIVVVLAVCVALSIPVERAAAYAAEALSSFAIDDGSGQTLVSFSFDEGVLVRESDSSDALGEVSDEIWIPADAQDVYCLADGDVVGYVVAGGAESVLQDYTRRMEERGWTSVAVGGAVNASAFVKDSGSRRYVLATFSQVESDVCVVLRIESER